MAEGGAVRPVERRVAGRASTEHAEWPRRLEAVLGHGPRPLRARAPRGMPLTDLASAVANLIEGAWLNQCLTSRHPADEQRRPRPPSAAPGACCGGRGQASARLSSPSTVPASAAPPRSSSPSATARGRREHARHRRHVAVAQDPGYGRRARSPARHPPRSRARWTQWRRRRGRHLLAPTPALVVIGKPSFALSSNVATPVSPARAVADVVRDPVAAWDDRQEATRRRSKPSLPRQVGSDDRNDRLALRERCSGLHATQDVLLLDGTGAFGSPGARRTGRCCLEDEQERSGTRGAACALRDR